MGGSHTDCAMTVVYDDRAVYVSTADTLVLADLHLDYALPATAETQSVVPSSLVPRYQRLLKRYDPAEVVIAGDIFETTHEPPTAAGEAFTTLCELAYEEGRKVVVTPGNHDRRGVDLLQWLPEPSTPEYRLQDDTTVVLHGNRTPTEPGDRFIVGHMHPMVETDVGRLPGYLVAPGAFHGAEVVVLPPFNSRVQGVTIRESLDGRANAPVVRDSRPFDGETTQCLAWDDEQQRVLCHSLDDIHEMAP